MDRAIQEGTRGGTARLQAAMQWVADREGLVDIASVGGLEAAVLQQVVDDLIADIDIAAMLNQACTHISTLDTAASAEGANVAGVLANAAAASARTEVDNAVAAVPRKSPGRSRTNLESNLPTQRTRLDFSPPPATIALLRTLLADIRRDLRALQPNAGNAAVFRDRVRGILGSALAAPAAVPLPAAPAGALSP